MKFRAAFVISCAVAVMLTACSTATLANLEADFGKCQNAVAQTGTGLSLAVAGAQPILPALNAQDQQIANAVVTGAQDLLTLVNTACAQGETDVVSAKLPVLKAQVSAIKACTAGDKTKAGSCFRGAATTPKS